MDYWFFTDTGKHTPGDDVENLERSYEARHGNKLQNIIK